MKQNDGVRLQKALSECGYTSRRAAEKLIEEGRVKVNGHPAFLGMKIDPRKDLVRVDGHPVEVKPSKDAKLYVLLYKPRGYVTTMKDELGRKCVTDLTKGLGTRVYPVGRLDKDSEGVLLMTNDGAFANLMMHPRNHVSKTYRVTVDSDVNDDILAELAAGIYIDTGRTAPAIIDVLDKAPGRSVLRIVLHEGKNRQIRKMCEAVGLNVVRLKRIAVGSLKLGMLKPGEYRLLTPQEIKSLKTFANSKKIGQGE